MTTHDLNPRRRTLLAFIRRRTALHGQLMRISSALSIATGHSAHVAVEAAQARLVGEVSVCGWVGP